MNFFKIMLCMFLFNTSYIVSQDHTSVEIYLKNYSENRTVHVRLYPVSTAISGDNEINLVAKLNLYGNNIKRIDYINGVYYDLINQIKVYSHTLLPREGNIIQSKGFNFDGESTSGTTTQDAGIFGRGIYKAVFNWINNDNISQVDSVLIEQDAGDNYDLIVSFVEDLSSYGGQSKPGLVYKLVFNQVWGPEIPVAETGGYIRMWDPYPSRPELNMKRLKEFGNFIWSVGNEIPNPYEYFPLFPSYDCDLPLFPEQNQNTYETYSREGRITLNITLKKNISTDPSSFPFFNGQRDVDFTVEPTVILSVDKGNEFCIKPYTNSNFGNNLYLKSSISNDPDSVTTLRLVNGDSYLNNSKIRLQNNCKIISENKSKILMGDFSQIILNKLNNYNASEKPTLILEPSSNIYFGINSELLIGSDCQFINNSSNIIHSNNSKIQIDGGGLYEISSNCLNTHTITNGSKILLQGGELIIGDNSILVFDGSGCLLDASLGSNIKLGNNAKIVFKNGAKLEAGGSQISSVNGSLPGRGFVFENAGEGTTITNCVFNNLSNPIYILNTTYATSNINYEITDNIFNCNDKLNYAIESMNTNKINISSNKIFMQTGIGFGLLLRHTGNLSGEENPSPATNIKIENNEISNGLISCAIWGQTNAMPSINMKYNNIYGSSTNCNLYANRVIGDIKYNSISSNSPTCVSLNLIQAIPNILSNSFTSHRENIYNSYSNPKIGPNPENSSDGGWIWLGGKNNIQSLSNGNLYYSGGNALLDWGQNCFYKATGSYHLSGNIDEPSVWYYVRNNDFNNSNIPISKLFDIGSGYTVNTHSSGSSFGCNNSTDAGTIWLIRDLGDGITDTIYRTNNTSGYQPPADEVLYSTAINKKLIDNNFDAVSYFKSLINSYPSSSYTDACLYDLYDCYLKLDTSGNQTVKDILFTDLKNYLDSKILSGNYSDEFSDIAYQIGVMCLTVIAEYDDAMSGYEFIALYHPDAYIRLLASWEYSEIEVLLNGSGGLSSRDDNLTDEEYFVKLSKKVNKTLTGDPVKGKLKKTYEKSKTEKAERQKAEIKSNLKDEKLAKSEIQKINQKEQASKMKVVSVLRNSKSMTREEKDKRQIEDIVIGSRTEDEKQKVENMNITPERYELGQNYPNPFNPVTNIQFQIPSLKFVKLVVYDMLGREVKTLVNEIKSPGKYIVSFDASSLSSGVYFYKISAGEFSDVKRMVLIK